jgi:hypothetical protein
MTKNTSWMKCSNLILNTSTNISILIHILDDKYNVLHSQNHYKQWTFGLLSWDEMRFWVLELKQTKCSLQLI